MQGPPAFRAFAHLDRATRFSCYVFSYIRRTLTPARSQGQQAIVRGIISLKPIKWLPLWRTPRHRRRMTITFFQDRKSAFTNMETALKTKLPVKRIADVWHRERHACGCETDHAPPLVDQQRQVGEEAGHHHQPARRTLARSSSDPSPSAKMPCNLIEHL